MGTSLISEEERRFMWHLAFVLTMKHPVIAFTTYQRIRSFVTFHVIFMGPGYDLAREVYGGKRLMNRTVLKSMWMSLLDAVRVSQ